MKTRIVLVLCAVLILITRSAAQTFTVLYSFTGAPDASNSFAGLIRGGASNLYGTTDSGGTFGYGSVFKLDGMGKETVLYSFTGGADGGHPQANLARDAAGNLYGTTLSGGASGLGTVFKLSGTGQETVLHSFTGGSDGGNPEAAVILDSAGNLYGTTLNGGTSNKGTVFKLDTGGNETVLHNFTEIGGDGGSPRGALLWDSVGNLYGVTATGGDPACRCGILFKLDTTGKEVVLYRFKGGTGDGAYPYAALIRDTTGNLYGTTVYGGTAGYGTVFKLDRTRKVTVLHSFLATSGDGQYPYAGLVRDNGGDLYGVTAYGGTIGYGTVFKVDSTGVETVLHSFDNSNDGAFPWARLVRDSSGNFYGTASAGGASGAGTIFKFTP